MKNIEFKSGIYVMEIRENHSLIGYVKCFRKRPLGYSYEITKNIFKAYRWETFTGCQSTYYKLLNDRITFYEKTIYTFHSTRVEVDIKMKRKLKLQKINKLRPWYKKT